MMFSADCFFQSLSPFEMFSENKIFSLTKQRKIGLNEFKSELPVLFLNRQTFASSRVKMFTDCRLHLGWKALALWRQIVRGANCSANLVKGTFYAFTRVHCNIIHHRTSRQHPWSETRSRTPPTRTKLPHWLLLDVAGMNMQLCSADLFHKPVQSLQSALKSVTTP